MRMADTPSIQDANPTVVDMEGDAEASTTVVHEDEDGPRGLGRLSEESGGKRESHLPSPPLTRVGTNESVAKEEEEEGEGGSGKEMSEVHFHPGSELESGDGEREGGDGRAGTASPSSGERHGSQLRFDMKTPPSPQPWDVTQPPPAATHAVRGYGYGRDRTVPATTNDVFSKGDGAVCGDAEPDVSTSDRDFFFVGDNVFF